MPAKSKSSSSRTTTRNNKRSANSSTRKSDPGLSYDEFKTYEGQRYTGMKVGRSHKWNYDPGVWKETKVTPDLWTISYAVNKRRAGKAPEGSGVPLGTEYHWYVLAHQNVRKMSANEYTTSLAGMKFKIAHRRAHKEAWSATPGTQRKRMIRFLQDVIRDLEKEPAAVATTTQKPVASVKRKRGKPVVPPSIMKKGWTAKGARSKSG